ncbi:MAG: hypothetical protein QN137_13535 [Armatimonadota bacterium]|nr:hypothetical protein [Armatimonadota bacterium]
MGWVEWVAMAAGPVLLFVVWGLVFCGGRRCRSLIDRHERAGRDGRAGRG